MERTDDSSKEKLPISDIVKNLEPNTSQDTGSVELAGMTDEELQGFHSAQKEEKPTLEEIELAEALNAAPVLGTKSERQQTRILIITKDDSATTANSLAQKRFIELASVFAEVHVLVLTGAVQQKGLRASSTVTRLANNAWVYATESSSLWRYPLDVYHLVKGQLVFSGDFRADIIVTEDPFESGLLGYFLAYKYKRSFQLHLYENYFDPMFKEADQYNSLRLWAARFIFKRVSSVQTKNDFIKNQLIKEYPDLDTHTEVLPRHYNLAAYRDAQPASDLHKKYPQFKFIVLHVTEMHKDSHSDRVITGMLRMLKQYPTVGLVIVGDGEEREALMNQVATFEVSAQVVFEDTEVDRVSALKTADILVYLSENSEEDAVVLQAAAVRLPMILGDVGIGKELFTDGDSAFFCPIDSPSCISKKVSTFLNQNTFRMELSRSAQNIVFDRVEQDLDEHLQRYRRSIERSMLEER